jgi:hypothetical protein
MHPDGAKSVPLPNLDRDIQDPTQDAMCFPIQGILDISPTLPLNDRKSTHQGEVPLRIDGFEQFRMRIIEARSF